MFARSSLRRNFLTASRCLSTRGTYVLPRAYSTAVKQLADLDASKLIITKSENPKPLVPPKDLVFGKTFTGMHAFGIVIRLFDTISENPQVAN